MSTTTASDLREHVRGTVTGDADAGYDEARSVYNAMIDKHPRAVLRALDAQDVAWTVRHAHDRGLEVAVRGGGHSVAGFGTSEGGIVIDLGDLCDVTVDPGSATATVGGGTTWGMFDAAAHPHGLATTGGIISTTGVGGLTLGGGIGYLARAHGLSCDNLTAAEVVLADGRIVTASAESEPDLFWALRGGGGNFGVVTRLDFALHPVDEILGGPMFFELSDAEAVLRHYREMIRTAPRAYGGFPAWQIAPPLPFVPQDRVGDTFLAVVSCWTGDDDEGRTLLQGFRDVAQPAAEHIGRMPYPALNSAFDGLVPRGLQHYWKAAYVSELTDEAIAAHLTHGPAVPVVNSTMHLYPIDGACHDVAADATAFGHREASFACVIAGMWPDPADNVAHTEWVRGYYAAIAPHSDAGGYVNFASVDDDAKVRENVGSTYDRLAQVKAAYDPDNVFHLNQNVLPDLG